MNQQIKQQWIEALRSGEYSQAQEELRVGDSFCCLGVLCDLYGKSKGANFWKETTQKSGYYYFESLPEQYEYGTLPINVSEWAGLGGIDIPVVEYGEQKTAISDLNDKEQLSFNQIAAIIEEQL
jgi:hypothetical protein